MLAIDDPQSLKVQATFDRGIIISKELVHYQETKELATTQSS
jgi:hypothetical protein